jgi:hypothetical protein
MILKRPCRIRVWDLSARWVPARPTPGTDRARVGTFASAPHEPAAGNGRGHPLRSVSSGYRH